MARLSVSIVIPSLNGCNFLAKNIPFLIAAWENPENNIIEIIVVDDGSTDGSWEFIKKNYPNVRIIKHTKNRGFSAAANTGVRMAKGKLIALINNDVTVSNDFMVSTFSHFEDNSVFAVSLHEKGYSWAKAHFQDGFLTHSQGEPTDSTHISFWASGGSAVFNRNYWMELGGLDEKLFTPFYWEDIDLSYRAQKRGLKILWEPKAKVVHEHESTIKKLSSHYVGRIRERNELLFIWKNFTSKNITRKHLAGLVLRILKHPGYIRIVLMALGRWGLVKKARRKEEKEQKVSDEAILVRF